jgi:superfamily II DNA helicase RecQ
MKKEKQKMSPVSGSSEVTAILRAADDIIGSGGRTLLAKILKGSKEKKVLELELDQNPFYGFFRSEKTEEVMEKIDWMILHDYLDIQYSGKLPMIIFTEKGWLVARDVRADEFLREWDHWIAKGIPAVSMEYLKDRNRGMILVFLEKIKETGNRKYIPFLRQWDKIEYKKVRQAIQATIHHLEHGMRQDVFSAEIRSEELRHALEPQTPQPEWLKCWECGERFIFDVEEQMFFKMKGFVPPKRCPSCREKRWLWEHSIESEFLSDDDDL